MYYIINRFCRLNGFLISFICIIIIILNAKPSLSHSCSPKQLWGTRTWNGTRRVVWNLIRQSRRTLEIHTNESRQHDVLRISCVAKQQNLWLKSGTGSSRAWERGSTEMARIAVTNQIRGRSEGFYGCPYVTQWKANTQRFCEQKRAHKLQTTVFLTHVSN